MFYETFFMQGANIDSGFSVNFSIKLKALCLEKKDILKRKTFHNVRNILKCNFSKIDANIYSFTKAEQKLKNYNWTTQLLRLRYMIS